MNKHSKLRWITCMLILGFWSYLGYKKWTQYSVSSDPIADRKSSSLRSESSPQTKKQSEEKPPLITEIDKRGVLPVSWTEERVREFFKDNEGESLDHVINLLGKPRDQYEYKSQPRIHYVIEGRFNNIKVGTDFSGFTLIFKNNQLYNISLSWGYQT